jgi:type II secretory pathway pseudopilin PulG
MRAGGARARVAAAFTLVDVMITVALIAVIAVVALPALSPSETLRVMTAASTLAADLEMAQSASLASPDDPVVVVVVEKETRYFLARVSDVATPIQKAGGDPYEVVFGQGNASALGGLRLELVAGTAEGQIEFDGFGRLKGMADGVIAIGGETGEVRVRVRASTGSVVIGD